MTRPADGPAVVLLTAQGGDEAERTRQRLEAAGVRVLVAASEDEARRAAMDVGAPPPPSDVAQMVVHHLKGPLTGLFATLEMLAEGDMGPLDGRQRVAVEELRARGEEMLALVEDLLHVWRVESPALALVRTSMRPADLLAAVGDEWRAAVERAGGQLRLDVSPSLPVVPVDAGVLRRVFGNLLHNALQHAGRAAIVSAGAKADGAHVVFHVSDTGVGIPGEFRDAIFRPFARVPRAEARAPRGTGLGLAFCRLAVLAHGGTIGVESEEGKGTTFRFRLPAEPADEAGGPV